MDAVEPDGGPVAPRPDSSDEAAWSVTRPAGVLVRRARSPRRLCRLAWRLRAGKLPQTGAARGFGIVGIVIVVLQIIATVAGGTVGELLG